MISRSTALCEVLCPDGKCGRLKRWSPVLSEFRYGHEWCVGCMNYSFSKLPRGMSCTHTNLVVYPTRAKVIAEMWLRTINLDMHVLSDKVNR